MRDAISGTCYPLERAHAERQIIETAEIASRRFRSLDGLSIHALSHPPQIVRIADAVVYDDCLGRSRQPVFKRQTRFFLLILCGLRIG